MDKLRVRLQQLRRFTCSDGSSRTINFVPQDDLYSLLTREALENAVSDPAFKLESHYLEPVVGEVMDGARKIFAILVELKQEGMLKVWLEKCLTDSTLPITDGKKLLELLPGCASHFQRVQWEYVPLKLRERSHKELEPGRIVPIVESEKVSSGGSSAVFKVLIHPQYQDWVSAKEATSTQLVRKEIFSSISHEAQRREFELLFLLRSMKNANIVQLVTSYTQNGFCSLLFPVADCDLHALLLNVDQPEWVKEATQVFDSLRDLTDGLDYLHNFIPFAKDQEESNRIARHGYHHDIKPKNILVYGTRLVLADFGLSRLKESDEDTQTTWKNTPPTYRAPEACNPVTLQPRPIGRAFDIWSLGCVISEFTTYVLGGTPILKEFRKVRVLEDEYGSANCFHYNGEISSKVTEWFRQMETNHKHSPMHKVFAIVEDCLAEDPTERITSQTLLELFDWISLDNWLQVILRETSLPEGEVQQQHSMVYQAKLTLERNRLQAWAYATGLLALNNQKRPKISQVDTFYEKTYDLLKDCATKLTKRQYQSDKPDSQYSRLDILITTNDCLLLTVSDTIGFTIDHTFRLLSVSSKQDVRVLTDWNDNLSIDSRAPSTVIATKLQSATAVEQSEMGLRAAARYMSHMLASTQSSTPERVVNVIDTSLLDSGQDSVAISDILTVKWLYHGYRESDRQMVLVEERSYDGKWLHALDDEFEGTGQQLFTRVLELAKLFYMKPKPKDMRLLDCLGVYHSPLAARFGLVYQIPLSQPNGKPMKPITLSNFIRGTKNLEQHPTLNDKFVLSQALVSCVSSLHLTHWIHKSISSSNIVLFHEQDQSSATSKVSEPYFTGFRSSREIDPKVRSEGMIPVAPGDVGFIHPVYRIGHERYHPAFDYYSLGVVLLEIALWRPLNKILSAKPASTSIKSFLSTTTALYVPQRMGIGYVAVITSCLNFFDKYSGEESYDVLLMNFQREILERLRGASLPQYS